MMLTPPLRKSLCFAPLFCLAALVFGCSPGGAAAKKEGDPAEQTASATPAASPIPAAPAISAIPVESEPSSLPTVKADPFIIFSDGKANASIVIAPDAPPDVKQAVEVFRNTIREGYGVDIPIGGDLPNRIEIVSEKLPLLKDDKCVVDFPNANTMRITGGQTGITGTLFKLLEDHGGIRFLYQGVYAQGTKEQKRRKFYPPLDQLAIPRDVMEYNPAYRLGRSFPDTEKYFGAADGKDTRRYFWNWQAQLGAKSPIALHHNLGSDPSRNRQGAEGRGIIFPIDKYVEAGVFPSEEMFPIVKGKRFLPYEKRGGRSWFAHWQPCFTSKVTEEEAVKNILEYLEKHPETTSVALSVNDNGGHCECETCMKVDSGKMNSYGMSNRSESYYQWVNKVVARVTEKYPDMMFGLIAYREVFDPPTFVLHPNVAVILTMDFQSTIDPEVMELRKENIRKWAEKAQHVGFWSYDVGPPNWSIPRAYAEAQQEMLQFFDKNNGDVAFAEAAHFFTLPEGPKLYLYFKLLQNPYLDRVAVMKDWCEATVGAKAAPYLYDYFAFWEDYWKTKATKVGQFWSRKGETYLQRGHFATYVYGLEEGDMAHCRSLMEKVVAEADASGTADQKERAALMMSLFEWYESAVVATAAEPIDNDGLIPSAEAALTLLKNIPKAVQARERWTSILKNTPDWNASEFVLDRQNRPGVVASSMVQVAPWVHEPAVAAELQSISNNEALPAKIRLLAQCLLETPDKESSNRMVKEKFEDGAEIAWKPLFPIHGKVVVAEDPAAPGSHALEFAIEHPSATATRSIPDYRPDAEYFARARIFIPDDGKGSDKGTVEFWGQPNYVGWNQPLRTLKRGSWNEVVAYIPRGMNLDADQLAGELGGVQESGKIKDMAAAKLSLRFKGFNRGTKVYIDDVEIFKLPVGKDVAPD